ncbi:MAG: hypothetical protein CM15mV40_160 [Caudoviricetes sp.]|nr:MAG: hypothetical protein CM15mV40_160 [Caudoviricetes sp.]
MTNSDEEILSTDPSARYRSRNTDKKSGASSGGFITVVFYSRPSAGWFIYLQQKQIQAQSVLVDETSNKLALLEKRLSDGFRDVKEERIRRSKFLFGSLKSVAWAIANERNKGWIKTIRLILKNMAIL